MKHPLASCLLALAPTLCLAQEIPDALIGVWATPTCAAPADTLVIYKNFYLWLGEEETALTGLTASAAQPDGWTRLQESDGYPNFFQIQPDGRLREAFLPESADKAAAPSQDWQTADYESCANALPPGKVLLHGEPVALLRVISNAQGLCETDRQACANQLFAGIDVSGDGNLSVAEIARLFRVAGYVAAVGQDTAANNDDLAGLLAAGLPLGPLLASAIVNSFDYNNDSVVSLAELSQDRGTLIEPFEPKTSSALNSRLNQMREALKPLGQLLDHFGK